MAHRILILGAGGREHALAWKLSRSDLVERIFVAPGNGGTAHEAKTTNVALPEGDFQAAVQFSLAEKVHDTFTGPLPQTLMPGSQDYTCPTRSRATTRRWR